MQLYHTLEAALKRENNFITDDGDLKKWVVISKAQQYDEALLARLIKEPELKTHFFKEIAGHWIFNLPLFLQFLEQKEYLTDSYTAFKNKVGLQIGGHYLKQQSNVALVWPYKDCILEGGQTTEERSRTEIFFNTVLAQDEITQLLEPKVLTAATHHTSQGEMPAESFTRNKAGQITDNLIIKGNNLLALHSIKKEFTGRVNLIYIDPPYNTGNDGFNYNDAFNHSTWLTFMKNRLEVARDLLSEDGSLWINIDDVEAHYLKVAADEIFDRENFVANIIWQKKFAPQNDARYFSDTHDHILVYARNKANWSLNLMERTEESKARYKNPDNDPRGDWTSGDLTVKTYNADYDYEIVTPSKKKVRPPQGICWRVSKAKFIELVADGRVWFGEDGGNVPRLKRFLSEVKEGITPVTIWPHSEVGHNQEAKQELNKPSLAISFATPKPERLLQRIIHIATNTGDIVLDYHLGSGTTAAVAHKMGRQYIGIEQMDYIETTAAERLRKVIAGEPGGISKSASWQGGGSFIYCELKNTTKPS